MKPLVTLTPFRNIFHSIFYRLWSAKFSFSVQKQRCQFRPKPRVFTGRELCCGAAQVFTPLLPFVLAHVSHLYPGTSHQWKHKWTNEEKVNKFSQSDFKRDVLSLHWAESCTVAAKQLFATAVHSFGSGNGRYLADAGLTIWQPHQQEQLSLHFWNAFELMLLNC